MDIFHRIDVAVGGVAKRFNFPLTLTKEGSVDSDFARLFVVERRHIPRTILGLAFFPQRILVKGTNFDLIDQDDVCMVLSHVNSYSRSSLDNSTPYDEFVKEYGYEGRKFLERLGIARIPANEVTLDPYLLGKKFKRHSDKDIIRKAGVTK